MTVTVGTSLREILEDLDPNHPLWLRVVALMDALNDTEYDTIRALVVFSLNGHEGFSDAPLASTAREWLAFLHGLLVGSEHQRRGFDLPKPR